MTEICPLEKEILVYEKIFLGNEDQLQEEQCIQMVLRR